MPRQRESTMQSLNEASSCAKRGESEKKGKKVWECLCTILLSSTDVIVCAGRERERESSLFQCYLIVRVRAWECLLTPW